MSRLAEPGRPSKILLDFEDAPFLPYAVFEGRLILLQRRIEGRGGLMKMANLHPSVRQFFRNNRLDEYFVIHDSIEEALRAFPDTGPEPGV